MPSSKIAPAAPFSGAPRINLASVFGASPRKPFLLRIPVTGQRPITYSAQLPEGLALQDNIITGSVQEAGDYTIRLFAENALGKAEKTVTLEIRPEHVLVTPLLGFTSWNAFGSAVTQADMEAMAQRLEELGLTEYGYRYVNLDSGWQSHYGGEFDAVMPNEKFPDMKAMTDRIHSLGLKCGIYSTPMLTAWGCPVEFESIPGCTVGEPDPRFTPKNGGIGLERKERNNARQWEAWGFDYLKYDWWPTDPVNADLMRRELMQLNRDFAFNVSTTAIPEYADYWSRYCNSYRWNPDTHREWPNLLRIYRSYFRFIDYVNKGHYFDLDMLDLGTCHCHSVRGEFTEDEQVLAFSIRVILNSPIQISSTLEEPTELELALYCNEEILAVNQDAAFCTAQPIYRLDHGDDKLDIIEKELEDGSFAYAFFNIGETEQKVYSEFSCTPTLRDLWAKEDLESTQHLWLQLPPHSARILKSSQKITAAATATV